MASDTLSSPAKYAVALILSFTSLLALFSSCLALLYLIGSFDYERSVAALWLSGLGALLLFAFIAYSSGGRYVFGEERGRLAKGMAWASVVLPLEAFCAPHP